MLFEVRFKKFIPRNENLMRVVLVRIWMQTIMTWLYSRSRKCAKYRHVRKCGICAIFEEYAYYTYVRKVGAKLSGKYVSHLKILGATRMTRSKLHSKSPQILGAYVKKKISRCGDLATGFMYTRYRTSLLWTLVLCTPGIEPAYFEH